MGFIMLGIGLLMWVIKMWGGQATQQIVSDFPVEVVDDNVMLGGYRIGRLTMETGYWTARNLQGKKIAQSVKKNEAVNALVDNAQA